MPARLELVRLPAGDAAVDAEIDALLARCPGSYAQQTPGWRNVIAFLGQDEALFLGCRAAGRLVGLLPGYRFEGPLGAILTSCAQAGPLGGVACADDVDPEPVYALLLEGFTALAGERGCALATVISNPLWPDRELCARWLRPDFELENACQVLDLESALGPDGELCSPATHVRRNLGKALAGNLVVDEEQSLANVLEWYELHAARHREIGAVPLPRELFTAALEQMVPRGAGRFFFVRSAATSELAAGGFYVCHGSVIDALMPSIRTSFAALAPNYLLAFHSMRWARARGLRFYNWQPSPPQSGVYRYKRQWGSRDVPYGYLTRITGDVQPFLRSSVDVVRTAYRWHYALPFDRIGAGKPETRGASSRQAAWQAGEAGPR